MKNKGFTLIEIMIVVAIVATLAAIAIPNLTKYLRESKRTDAVVALNGLQQAQAKLRANCRWYAEDIGGSNTCDPDAAADTVVKYSATTDSDLYTISIAAGTASGNAYTAKATAKVGGSQEHDADCQVFVLTVDTGNPNGAKTSINSANVESTVATDTCWK